MVSHTPKKWMVFLARIQFWMTMRGSPNFLAMSVREKYSSLSTHIQLISVWSTRSDLLLFAIRLINKMISFSGPTLSWLTAIHRAIYEKT